MNIRPGTQLLDKAFPGWAQKVNLETLNMWDIEACILAQAGQGHVDVVLHRLCDRGLYQPAVHNEVFNLHMHSGLSADYLEKAWRRAVKRRRKETA